MVSELLRQVRVVDPVQPIDRVMDVLLVDGAIAALGNDLTPPDDATTVHTFTTPVVLGPGLIDLYSHSGEPGHEDRETLKSLGEAAIAGGFTHITLLPDTDPPLDTPAAIAQLHQQAETFPVTIHTWGALTQKVKGEQMSDIGDLAGAGIVGWADGQPIESLPLLRRLLEYLQPQGLPVGLWPCDRSLVGSGTAREGAIALTLGLAGIPALAETVPLAAILELVRELGTPVHLMRISTARSVALIRQAQAEGLPVTASTTWMHLLGNTATLAGYDPHWRLAPPVGNPDDQQALQAAVRSGVVQAIAIDHSPYTYEEKAVAFGETPPGAIGLELALPLLWQALVEAGTEAWSALELWRSLSLGPAQCLGLEMGAIALGKPANLTLFDPTLEWTVGADTLRSRSCNTPWWGQRIRGKVLKTWYTP